MIKFVTLQSLHYLSMGGDNLNYFKYILSICFWILSFLPSLAQSDTVNAVYDSVKIRSFDGSLYRGSSFNTKVVENEDGILFICNENGLLEFDGASWILHQTSSFSPVYNLELVGDKIYTTGADELGYFQRDTFGKMRYFSLRDKIELDEPIRDVWYMNEVAGKVYYNSYKHFLVWDGELLKNIDVSEDLHSFEVGGELLVSVFNKGLAVVESDSLRYVNTKFKFKEDAAYSIKKNSNNEWLIFTSESGFFKLDSTDYSTSPWNTEINDYFLRKDRLLLTVQKYRDSLFVASSWTNGLVVFDNRGRILKHYDESSGLSTKYYNNPMIDRRGNIWVASALGIDYIEWIRENEMFGFDPATVVRYVSIGDSTIFVKNQQQKIDLTGETVQSISFQYATPSFITQDLEYSFYLEGFEENWSNWNTETRKEYTNLEGGDYTFHVRARHNYLKDLKIEPFSLSVQVPTPWYLNKWYIFMCVVALTGIIAAFIRYRTQNLSSTNKKLEQMVQERTAELVSQKEQLKAANEELQVINSELDNFVYRSSHDLVAPLKSLRGLIQITQNEKSADAQKDYFKLMITSISKLEDFIKSIMDFSTNSKKPVEYKNIKLDELLDSITNDIKYYENSDKVVLHRLYDSDFELNTDAKRLHIVLSNLVTNAVKYHNFSQEGQPYIKVMAKQENGHYEIKVEDNGQGIPEEYHAKIFDMFFRAHQGVPGSGLGLYIVVDTLSVMGGSITFESKPRKGTSFKIILPAAA